jgi:hypothetical protein
MIGKEYSTLKDNLRGKIVSHDTIRVNESFVLKDVALVSNLHLICFRFRNSMSMVLKCALRSVFLVFWMVT